MGLIKMRNVKMKNNYHVTYYILFLLYQGSKLKLIFEIGCIIINKVIT